MEQLCELMEEKVNVHDPFYEYHILKSSQSLTLDELSRSRFLLDTFHRYRKYLMYVNFEQRCPKLGQLVLILINDFLSYEKINCNMLVLAAKCVSIDMNILSLLGYDDDDVDSVECCEE